MTTIFDPPRKSAIIFVDVPGWYDEMTLSFYAARQFGNDCLKLTVRSWAVREVDPFNNARSLTLDLVNEPLAGCRDVYVDVTHDHHPDRSALLTKDYAYVRHDGKCVINVAVYDNDTRTVIDVYLGDIPEIDGEP